VHETLEAAAKVLRVARDARNSHEGGPGLNKGPGLSDVARDNNAKDRNTAACVTRIEEVLSMMRMRGANLAQTVVVVEWQGHVNYDMVLAALAVAGVMGCVDAGQGAFSIGKVVENNDPDSKQGAYVCLVPHADRRGLPRMPTISYEPGDSITQRFEKLMGFVAPDGTTEPVIYIIGGATSGKDAPADVVGGTLARLDLLREAVAPGSFICGDVMLPDYCGCSIDGDCLRCAAFDYAAFAIADECSDGRSALVKPRASFAHNAHFSLEWVSGADPDWMLERTLVAIDATVAANVARNAEWGGFKPREGPRQAHHPAYGEHVRKLISEVYLALVDGSERGVGDARTIVDSLVGI